MLITLAMVRPDEEQTFLCVLSRSPSPLVVGQLQMSGRSSVGRARSGVFHNLLLDALRMTDVPHVYKEVTWVVSALSCIRTSGTCMCFHYSSLQYFMKLTEHSRSYTISVEPLIASIIMNTIFYVAIHVLTPLLFH